MPTFDDTNSSNTHALLRPSNAKELGNLVGRVPVPASMNVGPNAYAIRVTGHGLAPDFDDGDDIIFDPDQKPDAGDPVLLAVVGEPNPRMRKLRLGLINYPLRRWTEGAEFEEALALQMGGSKMLMVPASDVVFVHKAIGKVRGAC